MGYAVSRGTITKHTNATIATGANLSEPVLDLLVAMGHNNGTSTTEEFVTLPAQPYHYNAANFGDPGDTSETKINAMIARIVADGATPTNQRFGFVPASMIPYTPTLGIPDSTHVKHNAAVHMVREGQGNWAEYDVLAYGAAPYGTYPNNRESDVGFAAAIDAAPIGATIRVPWIYDGTGFHVTGSILPPIGKNLRFKGYGFGSSGPYGTLGSLISGNFDGFLLDINGAGNGLSGDGVEVSGIRFAQVSPGSSAGCVRIQNTMNAVIERLGCTTANHGILLLNNTFLAKVSSLNLQHTGTKTSTSIGLGISGHTTCQSISAINFGYGVKFGSSGGGGFSTLQTLRCELNVVGVCIGLDILTNAESPTKGFALLGSSFESNGTSIILENAINFLVAGMQILNDGFGSEDYGMYITHAYEGLITGVGIEGSAFNVAGVAFNPAGGRGGVTISNTNAGQSGWILPTSLAGFVKFDNCDTGELVLTLTANSTTPDVRVASGISRGLPVWWKTANTVPTTITQFSNGLPGQKIIIRAGDVNTTIQHGTNIFLKGAVNKTLANKETIALAQYESNRWDEI